jgi:trehalose-phosphatase
MIIEIRPARLWNKGSAVEWIRRNLAPTYLPCYIGDDITDEDAFRSIGNRGITVRIVRSARSRARYFVRNVDQLVPWFDELMALRV